MMKLYILMTIFISISLGCFSKEVNSTFKKVAEEQLNNKGGSFEIKELSGSSYAYEDLLRNCELESFIANDVIKNTNWIVYKDNKSVAVVRELDFDKEKSAQIFYEKAINLAGAILRTPRKHFSSKDCWMWKMNLEWFLYVKRDKGRVYLFGDSEKMGDIIYKDGEATVENYIMEEDIYLPKLIRGLQF